MRLDYVMYKRSTLSVPKGYLEIADDGVVTFTKYKNQLEGRMHVVAWAIYQIALSFMKDKELINLKKDDIKSVEYKENKAGLSFGGKYGELLVKTNNGTFEFYIDPDYDQEKVAKWVAKSK